MIDHILGIEEPLKVIVLIIYIFVNLLLKSHSV